MPSTSFFAFRSSSSYCPSCLQLLHGLNTGGHGEGVSREGAGLVHGSPAGATISMMSLLTAVGADGESTANDLTHGGDIGGDAKVLLGSSVGDAEPGHDLVEDAGGLRSRW